MGAGEFFTYFASVRMAVDSGQSLLRPLMTVRPNYQTDFEIRMNIIGQLLTKMGNALH